MNAAVNVPPYWSTESPCPGPDSAQMVESLIICDEIRRLVLVAYAVF